LRVCPSFFLGSVLPSFFSASAVCPSLLIDFFPACPVCLSIQPSTCSQSSLQTHSHSLCWPSFSPQLNSLI
jgi:hypothetical protein